MLNPALQDHETSLPSSKGERIVCAVVVTYNRRQLLRECLLALQDQTRRPDHVLVIDNASNDGTWQMLQKDFPEVQVLRLSRNLGGSGGFHVGMREAFNLGFEWLWLMDDDGRPAPDCLAVLISNGEGFCAVVPIQESSQGDHYGVGTWKGMDVNVTDQVLQAGKPIDGDFIFAFVGPLISRAAVEAVGLPNADFFIWFDDIEYALRLIDNPACRILAVPQARFFHEFGGSSKEVEFLGRRSLRPNQPAWKSYYNARNPLYIITRVRWNLRDFLFYCKNQIRAVVGEIVYEPDRFQRLAYRGQGIRDGILGRLGKQS